MSRTVLHSYFSDAAIQGGPKKVSHYHEPLLNRIKTRY